MKTKSQNPIFKEKIICDECNKKYSEVLYYGKAFCISCFEKFKENLKYLSMTRKFEEKKRLKSFMEDENEINQ